MDISYLEELLAITKNMNISDVADQLFVSQSTLSRHIKKLEDELNVQLFDRSKQKITLTRSGEMILPYVENIVREHVKLVDAVSYSNQCDNQKMVIGFTSFAMTHELSGLIFDFAKKHPEISWQFIENNHDKLHELLDNKQCDFALIRHQYDSEAAIVDHINWDPDHYVAVLPFSHPLANASSLSLQQLEHDNFIMIRDHMLIIEVLYRVCGKWGFRPKIQTKSRTLDSVLNMVMYGEGVSIVTHSEAVALRSNTDVSFVEIEPRLNLITTLYYPFSSPPTRVHKEFIHRMECFAHAC